MCGSVRGKVMENDRSSVLLWCCGGIIYSERGIGGVYREFICRGDIGYGWSRIKLGENGRIYGCSDIRGDNWGDVFMGWIMVTVRGNDIREGYNIDEVYGDKRGILEKLLG